MKLDSRYADFFPEYSSSFGRALILMKYIYEMTNYGNLFAVDLTDGLPEAGLIQSQCQMSIYYKYTPYGTKIVFISYVDDCVYWYISEALGKWFVDTLGNIFHMKFLAFAHWFI